MPGTAEQLMRSRFAAYALELPDYLLATWHESTRPARIDLSDNPQWLGLKIKGRSAGGPGDAQGTVEFVARFKVNGRGNRMHENSRFVREGGRWYYVDGDVRS